MAIHRQLAAVKEAARQGQPAAPVDLVQVVQFLVEQVEELKTLIATLSVPPPLEGEISEEVEEKQVEAP